jgi:cyclase
MRRTLLVRISAGIFVLAAAWLAYTQTQAPAELSIQKVKGDLYVIAMAKGVGGGNIAVYPTNEGVILVDDMFDRDYSNILEKVKSVTDKPVRYVLNTHHHDDHAGGNAKMMASAEVIAHRNVRANMIKLNQPGRPRVTFTNEMDVYLGGKEVRSLYFGRGHTGGDAVIYFPELKVIHTGDLYLTFPRLPYIDFGNGGSAVEWTKVLDEILKLDFDVAIPGHGPVSNRADVVKWKAEFETMRNRISGLVHSGKDKDEVTKTLTGEFHWPAGGLAIQQVDAFIAELKQ